MAKNKRNKGRGKKAKNKSIPSQVDLAVGAPSALAVAAFQRSGAGFHTDKRRSRKRKNAWKRELTHITSPSMEG